MTLLRIAQVTVLTLSAWIVSGAFQTATAETSPILCRRACQDTYTACIRRGIPLPSTCKQNFDRCMWRCTDIR
jgi:hypothetical protein